jgi:putative membrane protein
MTTPAIISDAHQLHGHGQASPTPWSQLWQAVLMGGTGAMLLTKVIGGTLPLYVHSRYTPLVAAAGAILIILAIVHGWLAMQPPVETQEHARNDHEHGHDHASLSWRSPAMLALIVPLVLGLLVPARALGSAAIDSKGFGTSGTGLRTIQSVAGDEEMVNGVPDTAQWDMLDWVNALTYQPDNPRLQGQPIEMIGFVWRRPEMSKDQFVLSRFVVTCCTADGLAVGMPVVWPDGAAHPTDSWVRVKGMVGLATVLGQQEAAIIADEVASIPQPPEPYLTP